MTNTALKIATTEFEPDVGMTDQERADVANALSHVLADTYMLFIKTQGIHWNVTGPSFVGIHKLTEEHYENMYEAIDKIAERIRALGIKAPASYAKYGELSSISDNGDDYSSVGDMLNTLISDHQKAVQSMRKAIGWCEDKKDFVTADMMIERMAWHEEAIWMLKSLSASS
ncbi:Dps family protein [Parvularcula marina]|uniref:DNA starvation/stationary phase protection protein n=1 Tax=Parvularcula marina TaxID=2292771 RepID=A0A371RI71_9PROT|nr:DNA starvation/stationary phase protection protein [Parvularcula marina]RFB05157.1 DNA starvation/stationary phase protection protein [Parvularcula marina]